MATCKWHMRLSAKDRRVDLKTAAHEMNQRMIADKQILASSSVTIRDNAAFFTWSTVDMTLDEGLILVSKPVPAGFKLHNVCVTT